MQKWIDMFPAQTLPRECLTESAGIGLVVCKMDGTIVRNGLITVLYDGVFYLATNVNNQELNFIERDEKGRVKVQN